MGLSWQALEHGPHQAIQLRSLWDHQYQYQYCCFLPPRGEGGKGHCSKGGYHGRREKTMLKIASQVIVNQHDS